MRSRKFIPVKFLNGTIRESLYPRKLILALGDRESLSPRKFQPAKVYTFKVVILEAQPENGIACKKFVHVSVWSRKN